MKLGILAFILSLSVAVSAQEYPLYNKAQMPAGPFKGQEVDVSQIRGLVLIDNQKNILPESLTLTHGYIANVVHNDKFYVARVAQDSIQSVSFIYEKFVGMAGGHADLLYHLDKSKPLELIYEIKDAKNAQGFELVKLDKPLLMDHILLTAEAARVPGDKAGLKEGGLNNHFVITYRMTTIPERLVPTVIGEGRKTTVYDIPFDQRAAQTSFWRTVNEQSEKGMSENYNLISKNCITSAIEGLANGLTDKEKAHLQVEITRAMKKIRAMSRKDLTNEEIKKMVQDYSKILGPRAAQIKVQSILEKSYFTQWLTEVQKEIAKSLMCRNLF